MIGFDGDQYNADINESSGKNRWILNQLVLTFEAMKFKHWILNQ